jgi:hypothetical protein
MNQRALTIRRYFAALIRGLRRLTSHYAGSRNNKRQADLGGIENAQTTVLERGNSPRYSHRLSQLL